jgi:hypothetical protein
VVISPSFGFAWNANVRARKNQSLRKIKEGGLRKLFSGREEFLQIRTTQICWHFDQLSQPL